MAKRIFITATNTDVGKTYTTKLLLSEFASRGLRVGVIKPIETGVVDGFYPDGSELLECVKRLNSEFTNISLKDIVPISYELPAAPYIASKGQVLDLKKIEKSVQKLEKLCDILIIEGAGGLFVPIDEHYMMVDLIKYLKAPTLLVTHCSLGCINDTLLSKKVLQDEKIPHAVAFNSRDTDKNFATVSEPYFKQSGFEVLKVSQNIDTICDLLYNLQTTS